MKTAAMLTAALLALAGAPFATATTDSEAENYEWLARMHPLAASAELHHLASLLAARGIPIDGASAEAFGSGDTHLGEFWAVCQDVSWFFGGSSKPCAPPENLVSTGVPCFSVPAHWALHVYTPSAIHWEEDEVAGTPGFSWLFFYTNQHLGLGPGRLPYQPYEFTGSGCVFHAELGPGQSYTIAFGDGVVKLR